MMTRRPELDRRTPMWPPLINHKTSCSPVAESLHSAMASSILARFLLLSLSSDSCKWLKFSEGKLRTFDFLFYLYIPIGELAQNAYENLGCSVSHLKWPIFNSTTSKDHSYFCSSIDTVIAVYGFLSWVTVSPDYQINIRLKRSCSRIPYHYLNDLKYLNLHDTFDYRYDLLPFRPLIILIIVVYFNDSWSVRTIAFGMKNKWVSWMAFILLVADSY